MERPTLADVLAAARAIGPYIARTAFYEYVSLGGLVGARLFIKHENHHFVGSFKGRGTLNRMLAMNRDDRARGVVTASQGNHGLGVAWSAKITEIDAIVVVPQKANPDKVEAMRNLGAQVVHSGTDLEAADRKAWEISAETGATYLHAANDPQIIAGHATLGLEMFEEEPTIDTVVLPVGAGGLASGVGLVAKTLKPEMRVIGVQAERLPSMARSLREGHPIEVEPATTFAEGIAVRQPTELPFEMVRDYVDEILLVSEEEMRRAIILLLEKTHNLAEGAGAAGLAGIIKMGEALAGRTIGTVLSGGNIPWHVLNRALNDHQSW